MGSDKKQVHFEVPRVLFERFHQLFPVRGMKTEFFTRVMEVAVEVGRDNSFVKEVWEELEK